jgi:hypothetical protein
MTNIIVSASKPGDDRLFLSEPVHPGDVLRIGQPAMAYYSDGTQDRMRNLHVHVVQAIPGPPCTAFIGEPAPYAGMGSVWRAVAPGEAVAILRRARSEEA